MNSMDPVKRFVWAQSNDLYGPSQRHEYYTYFTVFVLDAIVGVVLFTSNCMTALSNPPTEKTFLPSPLNRTFNTCSACPLYSLYLVFSLGHG